MLEWDASTGSALMGATLKRVAGFYLSQNINLVLFSCFSFAANAYSLSCSLSHINLHVCMSVHSRTVFVCWSAQSTEIILCPPRYHKSFSEIIFILLLPDLSAVSAFSCFTQHMVALCQRSYDWPVACRPSCWPQLSSLRLPIQKHHLYHDLQVFVFP